MLVVLLAAAAAPARAQLREWRIVNEDLRLRTTQALLRYYAVVLGDSLRMRYVAGNAPRMTYRLRGTPGSAGTPGQIVALSLGQISIYPEPNVRIALGENLYESLVAARVAADADERIIGNEGFGPDDWGSERRLFVSLDRIDLHIGASLGLFAQLGAPESNLRFWGDGTGRVGVVAPDYEFALLFPLAAGATGVGPLRERRMAPAWGVSAMARTGPILARVRFAAPGSTALDAITPPAGRYVHTISALVLYEGAIDLDGAIVHYRLGGEHEEFARVSGTADSLIVGGQVRRLSPVFEVSWTHPDRTWQARAGFADLGLRLGFGVRLTREIWFDVDLACAGLFRPAAPFEHPNYLFITPTVKF